MYEGWRKTWVVFMAVWIGLFIGLAVTGSPGFVAPMGVLACLFLVAVASDWHCAAAWLYHDLGWSGRRSLHLRTVRLVGGLGIPLTAAVTVLSFLALAR